MHFLIIDGRVNIYIFGSEDCKMGEEKKLEFRQLLIMGSLCAERRFLVP